MAVIGAKRFGCNVCGRPTRPAAPLGAGWLLTASDEHLLERLRELGRRLDPVPERVRAAARATFSRPPHSTATEPPTPEMEESPMSPITSPVTTASSQVQQPLTLIMPIKSAGHAQALKVALEVSEGGIRDAIESALDALNTVHFARFVLLDGDPGQLAVITSYDDDFEGYIMSFTDELGPVFDKLLEFVEGAPPRPVQEHRDEFLAYVAANDLRCVGSFYSAYPDKRVADINAPAQAA